MSKAGLSLVLTAVTVLSAAAFKIVIAGIIRPALAADASTAKITQHADRDARWNPQLQVR
jgi:hypothetical protein